MLPKARAATAASGIALAMPILFAVGIGTPARAQSADCAALIQAGQDAVVEQIRLEETTIKQPTSVRDLTCLGNFFGGGLNLLTSLTDFGALANQFSGQICSAIRSAWDATLGSVNCGLMVTGPQLGFGMPGGGNLCGRLNIGGGGNVLANFGVGAGGGTYAAPLVPRPAGY